MRKGSSNQSADEVRLPFTRGPLVWLTYVVRAARVVGFTVVVIVLILAFQVHSVRASAQEQAVTLGAELAQFHDLVSGAHRVVINGETMYVASALSGEDVKTLLDRFQTYCDTRNGGVPADFTRMAPAKAQELRHVLGDDWLDHWGVVRDEADGVGTVMCIAQEGQAGVAGVMAKLRATMDGDWDLHALGDFRYIYARKVGEGKTQVLTSMTDGPFHLRRIFGASENEDAPGDDPPAAPRPPGSRRLLSSSVDGLPYGVQVFSTPQSVDEVFSFYRRELPSRGWSQVIGLEEFGGQAWRREGARMIVGAARAEGDDQTKVTFTEGRPGEPGE
jgi:hypothetical protein